MRRILRKVAAMLALILAMTAIPFGLAEEEFQEVSCSFAAGYYVMSEGGSLLLPDGTIHPISADEPGAPSAGTYKVFSDGERFIIEDTLNEILCFVPQREKGLTETGGVYYAVYQNYIGTVDQGFEEGSHVQFGNRVFDNDYMVVVREPLSSFFSVDGSGGGYGKIEGPGYASPEEAVTAYIEAFQRNDLRGMLSTFAVETLAEHYDLAKQVERIWCYYIALGYIPDISDYSHTLNVESRRSEIVDWIRYQYLTLTGAACADGNQISNTERLSGEEFLASIFAADDSPWLSEIDFQGEFLAPNTFTDRFDAEGTQEHIDEFIACYGGDEGRSLAARLDIAGKPYVQFMDAIRYGDRWYNLTPIGMLGTLLALDRLSGGLVPYPIPED